MEALADMAPAMKAPRSLSSSTQSTTCLITSPSRPVTGLVPATEYVPAPGHALAMQVTSLPRACFATAGPGRILAATPLTPA